MSTFEEACLKLNQGKGSGSYRIRDGDLTKVHLAYKDGKYIGVEYGEVGDCLTDFDRQATDWVIEVE